MSWTQLNVGIEYHAISWFLIITPAYVFLLICCILFHFSVLRNGVWEKTKWIDVSCTSEGRTIRFPGGRRKFFEEKITLAMRMLKKNRPCLRWIFFYFSEKEKKKKNNSPPLLKDKKKKKNQPFQNFVPPGNLLVHP